MKKLFVLGLTFIGAVSIEAVAMDNHSLKFGLEHVKTINLDYNSLNILGTSFQKDQVAHNFVQTNRYDDKYDRSVNGHRSPPPPPPHHAPPPPPPPHHAPPPPPRW